MAGGQALQAGAARTDITPDLGVQLAGDIGRYRPAEEIADRLNGNALALEKDGRRACVLSLDLLAVQCDWSDHIRADVAERCGLPIANVMLHSVQNHSSPSLGHFFMKDSCDLMPRDLPWLRGGDDRYHGPTAEKITQAAVEAFERLEPVTLAAGRTVEGRVAFNRRYILRDGSARMVGPSCAPDILCREGPADPEVGAMTFTNAAGQVVSALLHFTCHPCHSHPYYTVKADWPGAWVERMRERWGEACVPLVVNGCCGNVTHRDCLNPDFKSEYPAMAETLAAAADRALEGMEPATADTLATARTVLRLPYRQLTDEEIRNARDISERNPEPIWLDEEKTRVSWDWVYAVCTLDLLDTIEETPEFDYEVQAFRIGDTALVGVMGEPFVQGQLAIKERSPAPYTFVAHFCNGYAGYIPTPEALRRGGYETRTGNWSKFRPEALGSIVETSRSAVGGLFP